MEVANDVIPNEPGRIAIVQVLRRMHMHFGPYRGRSFAIAQHYVALSAAKKSTSESGPVPEVTWKLIRGALIQSDSPEDESLWSEKEVVLGSEISNAREELEDNLPGDAFIWQLLDAEPKPELLPEEN